MQRLRSMPVIDATMKAASMAELGGCEEVVVHPRVQNGD